MISRNKLFIVASNVDESIKSQTVVYDVTLFKTFVELEEYINNTPCVVDTIIITETDLQFNNVNMARLIDMLSSPFLKLTGKMVYLIGNELPIDEVTSFIETNEISQWQVYQGDLSPRFITGIVSGEGRETEIKETEVYTYRMRASDYIKYKQQQGYEDNERHYMTDEDLLAGIPDEVMPEMVTPQFDFKHKTYYIVGECGIERTLFTFVLAQYLSLEAKTLIVESDVRYHTLSDMVTKSGIKCELFKIEDLYGDAKRVLNKIKNSTEKLIVLTATERIEYDYSFVMDIVMSNTVGFIANFIQECSYNDAPYGRSYTIVCKNTVPEVLKCINSLKYDTPEDLVTFVGLQLNNVGPVNINTSEFKAIVNNLLGKNNLEAQVVRAKGVKLKGEDIIYDVLSLVGRGNEG